jgi:hypothetical protein
MHVASIALAVSLATIDPLAGELARFPSPEIAIKEMEFNQKHNTWLETNVEWLMYCDYDNWLKENDTLRDCWWFLIVAQGKDLELEKREEALMHLERLLGTTNFLMGNMPPPCPIWRFFDFPLPETSPEPIPA